MSVIQLVQVGAQVGPEEAVFHLLALIVTRGRISVVGRRFCCSPPWLLVMVLDSEENQGCYFHELHERVAGACIVHAPRLAMAWEPA